MNHHRSKTIEIPGINIQWPWSARILSGEKTVETRSYALPAKYRFKPLALIETPGPNGRKAGISKAHITGIIVFGASFQYASRKEWALDHARHGVAANDHFFAYRSGKQKWGWPIVSAISLKASIALGEETRRGIVFAARCELPRTETISEVLSSLRTRGPAN